MDSGMAPSHAHSDCTAEIICDQNMQIQLGSNQDLKTKQQLLVGCLNPKPSVLEGRAPGKPHSAVPGIL